jgi:uncharacterized protein YecE (DUF72 family)
MAPIIECGTKLCFPLRIPLRIVILPLSLICLRDLDMADFLVGAGGWAYFKVPGESSLKVYSEVFNFVEVNYTFYEYPDIRRVEGWRKTVPRDFTFAVRCHEDLTHRIRLKPVDEAYTVIAKMQTYCGILNAPFIVLETPETYILNEQAVREAKALLSSVNLKGVRLVWEPRAPLTRQAAKVMQDLNVVHSTDLSMELPSYQTDVMYSRLFGKGQKNLYQFTDEELVDIDRKVLDGLARGAKAVALSYHGARMYSDAARFVSYKKAGKFLPATTFTGVDSVKAVLLEDTQFPSSKNSLVAHQGWKIVDLTVEKRVHLSELLVKLPEKNYNSADEVIQALEVAI